MDNLDLEDMPENLLEIKEFLANGEPMNYFRLSYERFVNGEPLDDWNERVEAAVKSSWERQMASQIRTGNGTSTLIKSNLDLHTEQPDDERLEERLEHLILTNSVHSSDTTDETNITMPDSPDRIDVISDVDSLPDDDLDSVMSE